jgi:heptosyltransferase II
MTLSPGFVTDNQATRILIRATNWIGDSVMTMPAVQRLRELAPGAYIAMHCPGKLTDLWRHNPFLNEVIPFGDTANLRELREREFDVAVIFPNSFRSAWECKRAGIPRRVGFAGHWRRFLLTDVVRLPRMERPVYQTKTVAGKTFQTKVFRTLRHQSEQYLDIISYLGGDSEPVPPRIYLAVEEMPPLNKFLRDDGRPVVAINAGAEYGPAKRWPAERFAEAAIKVSHHANNRWLILGGPRDVDIADRIEAKLRDAGLGQSSVINVAGDTTLLDLCTLLRFSKVLLTNDTGPMHIAAAIGTAVISIWGSTSPELTGPLSPRSVVIRHPVECSPCFLRECPIDFRCMEGVQVDEVVKAVLKQLGVEERDPPPS